MQSHNIAREEETHMKATLPIPSSKIDIFQLQCKDDLQWRRRRWVESDVTRQAGTVGVLASSVDWLAN